MSNAEELRLYYVVRNDVDHVLVDLVQSVAQATINCLITARSHDPALVDIYVDDVMPKIALRAKKASLFDKVRMAAIYLHAARQAGCTNRSCNHGRTT